MKVFPVIMSGGSGTRLWPLSTAEQPKQFHTLLAKQSMIVETASRLSGTAGDIEFLDPMIIAGDRHHGLVASQLSEAGIKTSAVVLESEGRNTAATAALSALVAQEIDPEAYVLLMPADHIVGDVAAFKQVIEVAAAQVASRIVTFGIRPSAPETGFGYIQQGDVLGEGVYSIAEFKEKPDSATAQAYVDDGGYSWNSGVFFFSPRLMLEEFAHHEPGILEGAQVSLERAMRLDGAITLNGDAFGKVKAMPIDIAIMEKTSKGAVAPCDIGWADIGSWAEYWRLAGQDENGNVLIGPTKVLDGKNLLVRAEGGIHVSVAGVSDLIVIATEKSVMVLPRDRAQDVKKLIP